MCRGRGDVRRRGAIVSAGDAAGEQTLDQRPVLVAGRRVHHDTGRLVDDQESLVFVDQCIGNILGAQGRRSGAGNAYVTTSPPRSR